MVLLAIWLTLVSSVVAADEDSEKAFEIQRNADLVVDYDPVERIFDIGIRRLEEDGSAKFTQWFTKEQLVEFFKSQKRKDHVVIIFIKRWVEDDLRKEVLDELVTFFTGFGYGRITVQQHSAVSRGTWLDHIAEPE